MTRVEFPLGEIFTLVPLITLGIVPEPKIDPAGIGEKEEWQAQGLEGKGFVEVDDGLAQVLANRLGKYRCKLVPMQEPVRPMPIVTPPTPRRLR